MTIMVTGGCGFIGANFILDWMKRHDEGIINVDKITYSGNIDNLKSVSGDGRYNFHRLGIEQSEEVLDLMREHGVRAVVNFAAETHVDRSILNPEAFIQTNVVGVQRLLEASRRYWTEMDSGRQGAFRFLHVSTDEVYGTLEASEPAFSEASPHRPNSPYAASKAASDHLVRAYRETYGLPTLTTNCSNNYGPYQFPEKLIPLMICNALAGQDLPVYGDGHQIRDWLHVADHCAALERALDAGKVGETYNIGGDEERRNIDVVRAICAILDERAPRNDGTPYARQIVFVKDRIGHDRRYAIDGAKIARELGWRPSESFESGLRKTVDWYLANLEWVAGVKNDSYDAWLKIQYS